MRKASFLLTIILLAAALGVAAADFVCSGNSVTVRLQAPAKNGAKVVRLQVVGDNMSHLKVIQRKSHCTADSAIGCVQCG